MKQIPFQLPLTGNSFGNSSQRAFMKHQLYVTDSWAGNAVREVTQILLTAQGRDRPVNECFQHCTDNTYWFPRAGRSKLPQTGWLETDMCSLKVLETGSRKSRC